MVTQVRFEYEYKLFSTDQLKHFALNLARFCDMPTSEGRIFLHRKEDAFETSTQSTIEELDKNLGIGFSPESMGLHYKGHIIILSLENRSKKLGITYIIDGNLDNTKKLIFFIENTLELTRLDQDVNNPQNHFNQPRQDVAPDPNNESSSIESSNYLWHEVSLQLRPLLSEGAYFTWIAPLIPGKSDGQLILYCQNEFAKEWLESSYKNMIEKTVQSIDPSIIEINFQIVSKSSPQSKHKNKQFCLKVDESLFQLMKQVYEKKTEDISFENYFNQIIQSYCQERT